MSLMLLLAHPSLGKGNLSEKRLDKHTDITERSPTPQKYLEVKGRGLEEWERQTPAVGTGSPRRAFAHEG